MPDRYLATNIFDTDGVRTSWAFSFAGTSSESIATPYLFAADVKAVELYRDIEGNQTAAERTVFIDPQRPNEAVIVGPPIAAGRQVKIFRQTEIRFPLVDYRDRQSVSEADLDLANRQAIFVAQETVDAASNAMSLDKFNNYTVKGRRIVDLQGGKDVTDAATFGQMQREDARYHAMTLRTPVSETYIAPIPKAVDRRNRMLSFDDDGNPIVVIPATGSAAELSLDLANGSNPARGDSMVAHMRVDIEGAINTVQKALSTMAVSIWEYAHLITYRPTIDPRTWDWAPAIEGATQFVKSKGGGVVEFIGGTYSLTRAYRRNGVSWHGRGASATYFQALKFDPQDGQPYGLIEQEAGEVICSHMRGIHLLGHPENVNQWGMYLHAQWNATRSHGGLWMSIHDDIRLTYFVNGIWSRGGYTVTHYKRPQQFMEFRSVFVQCVSGVGEAIRLTGQHGQIKFTSGSGEGRDGHVIWRCMTLAMDPDPETTAVNGVYGESTLDTPATGNAVQSPINVVVSDVFSFQKSQEGIFAANAKNIVISGCWTENIGKFITLRNNANVVVEKNHLAKAADGRLLNALGTGYMYDVQSNSTLLWAETNNITGQVDAMSNPARSINDSANVSIKLGIYSGDSTGKFKASGYKQIAIDAAGMINLVGHKYSAVSANADQTVLLRTIRAACAPGETITIRAAAGPITLGTGGNLSLNGQTAVTVPNSGYAVLMRIYEVGNSGEYALISVTEHTSSSPPTFGYYAQGTWIKRFNPSIGSYAGVICTTAGIAGNTAVFGKMENVTA